MRKYVYLVLLILFLASKPGAAHSLDSLTRKIENLSGNFLANIQRKYSSVEKKISKKTDKYLCKMDQEEKKLQSQASNSDSGSILHKNIESLYSACNSKLIGANL